MASETSFLSTVEISRSALAHNMGLVRSLVGPSVTIAGCVKSNAYGHGLVEAGRIFLETGTDWLSVNALFEAVALREAGVSAPIYIMGYVPNDQLGEVIKQDCRLVVYNRETLAPLNEEARKLGRRAKIHIKVETGNNRQGVPAHELMSFAQEAAAFEHLEIEGLATHFANIEDIHISAAKRFLEAFSKQPSELTPASYPATQLRRFKEAVEALKKVGVEPPLLHCANSAATLLFPETHLSMVRPGVVLYGLWPSEEMRSYLHKKQPTLKLMPALSWRTRLSQIKELPTGSTIGYGCTYKTKRPTRLGILPVGYYDGYDRGLSNNGSVLIEGRRAPILGRICMNITMIDLTEIPEAHLETPVTLLGRDGEEEITADELAHRLETINYEIPTRIHEKIPRLVVE